MKKIKLLSPVLTIASFGAIITPISVLTSCANVNTGKDAELTKEYVCEFKPVEKKTYQTEAKALEAYKEYIDPSNTNGSDFKILRDDARYAYSEAFKTNVFKSISTLESYKLDFTNISLNKSTDELHTTFEISVKGTYTDPYYSDLKFTEGNFVCQFRMDSPFKIEFHKADDTTCIKKNYIKCFLQGTTAQYKLTGTCKMADGSIHTANEKEWTKFDLSKPFMSTTEQQDGYVAYNLVINGLTCNAKTPGNFGILYTNYMSLAEIVG